MPIKNGIKLILYLYIKVIGLDKNNNTYSYIHNIIINIELLTPGIILPATYKKPAITNLKKDFELFKLIILDTLNNISDIKNEIIKYLILRFLFSFFIISLFNELMLANVIPMKIYFICVSKLLKITYIIFPNKKIPNNKPADNGINLNTFFLFTKIFKTSSYIPSNIAITVPLIPGNTAHTPIMNPDIIKQILFTYFTQLIILNILIINNKFYLFLYFCRKKIAY